MRICVNSASQPILVLPTTLTQLDSVTHSSNQFIALCREQDVFIRDAENMGVTLNSRYVRFAVRSQDENLRIIACLEKLLSEFR